MYNPQNLHECEKEKSRNPRVVVDNVMTFVGIIASFSSIPQVLKIWQTGTVAGLSLTTQVLALGAVITWFAYGLYIKNKPLAITSGVSMCILAIVTIQILIYR